MMCSTRSEACNRVCETLRLLIFFDFGHRVVHHVGFNCYLPRFRNRKVFCLHLHPLLLCPCTFKLFHGSTYSSAWLHFWSKKLVFFSDAQLLILLIERSCLKCWSRTLMSFYCSGNLHMTNVTILHLLQHLCPMLRRRKLNASNVSRLGKRFDRAVTLRHQMWLICESLVKLYLSFFTLLLNWLLTRSDVSW